MIFYATTFLTEGELESEVRVEISHFNKAIIDGNLSEGTENTLEQVPHKLNVALTEVRKWVESHERR
jgi:hypothetical protein